MNLKEFADYVKERVIEDYGVLDIENVLKWLDNHCFLSLDEEMMVVGCLQKGGDL